MNAPDDVQGCEGWLFDLYPRRDEMVLWFIAADGRRLRLVDRFAPSFFVAGFREINPPAPTRSEFFEALRLIPGFEAVGLTERIDLWSGHARDVEEIRITDLDLYGTNLHTLARRFPDLHYFNCDILPAIHYCYESRLFPTARCAIRWRGDRLVSCRALDRQHDIDYPPPPLRTAELHIHGALAGPRPRLQSLTLTCEGRSITWEDTPPDELIGSLRRRLHELDPDLILTCGGDTLLMPALFTLAAQCRLPTGLDREPDIERELSYEGRSYVSYGQVLYHAPDYPLFGRWHIDRNNSFWTSESGIDGLLEVARMSKIPVQRAARRSIGTGITSIQLDDAYARGILIPWKKSQPEAWKSAATLLKSDRGGLVYQPVTGVYENVIELDFASMYPSIMVRCNVSPETVNCACCGSSATPLAPVDTAVPVEALKPDAGETDGAGATDFSFDCLEDVPELDYRICRRRRGLVSRTLEPIIAKRRIYKARMKESQARIRALEQRAAADSAPQGEQISPAWRAPSKATLNIWSNPTVGAPPTNSSAPPTNSGAPSPPDMDAADRAQAVAELEALRERYDSRQGALKWLLVCCFGYLGYRNARFGRIEAHESTCAFSREKLLQTQELCEAHGFHMIHAIVDCVWLAKPGVTPGEIDRLCAEINAATNLTIAVEGWYRWIAFLPSRQNPDMPVPARYFGCFEDGKLKYRGIEVRRSDAVPYAQAVQQRLLEKMAEAPTLAEIRDRRDELIAIVREAEDRLRHDEAPLDQLLLRRKTSKEAEEYKNNSMTAVAARQARRAGLSLHAGEALTFLVVNAKDRDPDSRIRLTPLLRPDDMYDREYYIDQLRRAAASVLEPILGESLASLLGLPEEAPRPKRRAIESERESNTVQLELF